MAATNPILDAVKRIQTQRRLKALAGWKEPSLFSTGNRRFQHELERQGPSIAALRETAPYEAAIALRTIELGAHKDQHAAWQCWHHINQARDQLRFIDESMNASLKGLDRALHGSAVHRVKMLHDWPDSLRARLEPAFSRGDLWDTDGAFEDHFEAWADGFLSELRPLGRPSNSAYPYARDVFTKYRPAIGDLLDEMLSLFPWSERGTDAPW